MPNNIAEQYGPEYTVEVKDAKSGLQGFLVIYNTALGPGKGGIRLAPDITMAEYRGYNAKRMFDLIKHKIAKSTEQVLGQSARTKKHPRAVAMRIAMDKVEQKMKGQASAF